MHLFPVGLFSSLESRTKTYLSDRMHKWLQTAQVSGLRRFLLLLLYSEQRMVLESPAGAATLTPVQSHSTRPGPDLELKDPGIPSQSTPAANTLPTVPARSRELCISWSSPDNQLCGQGRSEDKTNHRGKDRRRTSSQCMLRFGHFREDVQGI